MNRIAWKRIHVAGLVLASVCVTAQTSPHGKTKASVAGNWKSSAESKPNSSLDAAIHAMFNVRTFQQAEISPNGKSVAWVESIPGPGGTPSPNSAIYVAELLAPEKARRITGSSGGNVNREEHDVSWSPDGKRLAFLSDAATPGQPQLFTSDAAGGAVRQLTHLKGFCASPGWSPDGKSIAILFTENAPRAAGPLQAETPDEGEAKPDGSTTCGDGVTLNQTCYLVPNPSFGQFQVINALNGPRVMQFALQWTF